MSQEFLDLLQEVKEDQKFDVFVPSKQKSYKCRPVTIEQQQDVLRILTKNEIQFINECAANKKIGEIIKENMVEDVYDALNVIDRSAIIYQMRCNINNIYEVEKSELNLEDNLEKIKDIPKNESNSIEVNNIKFDLSVPSLKKDAMTDFNLVMKMKSPDFVEMTEEDLSILAIQSEISKYIDKITIKDTSITDNILDVLDKLPSKCVVEINKYLESVFSDFENIIKFGDREISIDSSFFISA